MPPLLDPNNGSHDTHNVKVLVHLDSRPLKQSTTIIRWFLNREIFNFQILTLHVSLNESWN